MKAVAQSSVTKKKKKRFGVLSYTTLDPSASWDKQSHEKTL